MARDEGFDYAAAVTRSMLGWGLVAGPFYLVFGLALAFTRPGFEPSEHALSLLMLGEGGWMQTTNLALTGLMTAVAGWGMVRALSGPGHGTGAAVIVAGAAMVLGALFEPDAVEGFPPGTTETAATVPGLLHRVAGGVEFAMLALAAFVLARFLRARGEKQRAALSQGAGAVIVLAFLAGAALSAGPAGVALLWLAVVVGLAWLLLASLRVYASVPHPDAERRAAH
jgi:hypothetical protein